MPRLCPYVGIGVTHPGRFTTEVVFRRCEGCGERNVVPDALAQHRAATLADGRPARLQRLRGAIREEKGRQTIEQIIGEDVHEFKVAELLDGIELPGARRRHDRKAVRLFVSYSHRDETHKATLGGHLLPLIQEGLIHWWDDRHLRPGDDWAGDIDRNLDEANVILLLVSQHFLASNYCRTLETPRALARHAAGEALVVPIILDGCDTWGEPFMARQVLPTDNRPILEPRHWPDPNDGWRQVVGSLREVVQGRRSSL